MSQNAPEPLVHAIVNGDTLEALAERYLGRADRAGEIFEANRTRLQDPEILPIGMKLTIPRRESPPAVHRQPLVPVAAPGSRL
jgi:nucleoid-associated protein YgaU